RAPRGGEQAAHWNSATGALGPEPFFAEAQERARDAADKVREQFEHVTKLRGVSNEWRLIPAGAAADPGLHVRYADLTILGQLDPDLGHAEAVGPRPELVALASGRPVLGIPHAGHFEGGSGGWSGGTRRGKPPVRSMMRCRCWRPRLSPC